MSGLKLSGVFTCLDHVAAPWFTVSLSKAGSFLPCGPVSKPLSSLDELQCDSAASPSFQPGGPPRPASSSSPPGYNNLQPLLKHKPQGATQSRKQNGCRLGKPDKDGAHKGPAQCKAKSTIVFATTFTPTRASYPSSADGEQEASVELEGARPNCAHKDRI